MKLSQPFQRKRARIEIIPLIDIVFFLLATFVMVSLSMVQNTGVQVQLPVAKTGQSTSPATLTISVTQAGELFVNETPISIQGLPAFIRQRQQETSRMAVIIQGDQRSALSHTMAILDCVRELGITNVAIRTRS